MSLPERQIIIGPWQRPGENHTEMSQALKERYKFLRPSEYLMPPFSGLGRSSEVYPSGVASPVVNRTNSSIKLPYR
jgi:hypothetical protein